jgi:hypothetical protein
MDLIVIIKKLFMDLIVIIQKLFTKKCLMVLSIEYNFTQLFIQ